MNATRTVVLVEGESDRAAVETLARRLGRDLTRDGVEVIALGGAHNMRNKLRELATDTTRVVSLCDEGEAAAIERALADAALETDGVFVCVVDLEDELIRAVGIAGVEAIIEQEGELRSLRTLQKQPAHRDRSPQQHLRRFIGSHSGRKLRYARLLAEALDLARVPSPLAALLADV